MKIQLKQPFFSVIVFTYNSNWKKTRETLLSIIQQKHISFEIIIADDGSKEKLFDQITGFFNSHNFINYKFVNNIENHGTVKNFISGINICSGKYIKPISPGDYFYSENSLFNAYSFIIKNKASVYFGRTAYYSYENNNIKIFQNLSNPKDIRPYLSHNLQQIKKNYFIKLDSILGASIIYDSEIIREYITILSRYVKFAEDYSVLLLLANNERIEYMQFKESENYFIWYESNTGISTQAEEKWHTILKNELSETIKYLIRENLIQQKYFDCNFSCSKFIRFKSHLLLDPFFYILNKIKSFKIKGWKQITPDTSFLLHIKESK